jgi:23S rRNA (guanosine2251-2'-O)-methyltransferase
MSVLLYGIHACRFALRNKKRIIEKIWIQNIDLLQKIPELKNRKYDIVDKKIFNSMLDNDQVHQGIIVKAQPLANYDLNEITKNNQDNQVILCLDQVQDPQNFGAILRSCATFKVDALLTTFDHSPKESGTLAKIASGALEIVPIIRVTNLVHGLKELQKQGFWCYGLDERGDDFLHKTNLSKKVVFVLGAEGKGLRELTKKNCDIIFKLPTGDFSTLNVANTASVVLYENFVRSNKNLFYL